MHSVNVSLESYSVVRALRMFRLSYSTKLSTQTRVAEYCFRCDCVGSTEYNHIYSAMRGLRMFRLRYSTVLSTSNTLALSKRGATYVSLESYSAACFYSDEINYRRKIVNSTCHFTLRLLKLSLQY